MTDKTYTDLAIFDALQAAVHLNILGTPVLSVPKFIETFNSHRDRHLCTSLITEIRVLVPVSLDREETARKIYEVEPHSEAGEWVDGFQVTPGGNLTWQQAKDRDAEFGDDPRMGRITEYAYRCADALGAK